MDESKAYVLLNKESYAQSIDKHNNQQERVIKPVSIMRLIMFQKKVRIIISYVD